MENQPNFAKETDARIRYLMKLILDLRFSDPDRDYAACMELLEISEREGYPYGIAYANAYTGDCLIGKNEGIRAGTKLLQAKELCEKHHFTDLLPNVCNWLGIYYEMQNDRQMAVQCYLDALEYAEQNQDLSRQSVMLNNIASQFQNCDNLEVAKEYYIRAFQCYNASGEIMSGDPHYAQMTANIVSVYCQLKQLDEARYYLGVLRQSGTLGQNRNQLFLCELLISAGEGNIEATRKSVDELLLEMQKEPKDIHQFFETFLVVARSMIELKEMDYAKKVLTTLEQLCDADDYVHRLRVQYVWMIFFQDSGTEEERNKAYKEFYELRQMSDLILNQNLAEGLLWRIRLRESIKKNEEIERVKVQLEDEVQLDELTQLYNRRSFRQLTEQVATDPQVHTLGFLMIDVDYFKQYNDTYGHAQGDEALRAVADSLMSASDRDIYNFRYGGDEFVSMCRNKTVEEIADYVETLRSIIRSKQIPHEASLSSPWLSLSIGYSIRVKTETGEIMVSEVMEEADKALYQAKARGRNGSCRYSD